MIANKTKPRINTRSRYIFRSPRRAIADEETDGIGNSASTSASASASAPEATSASNSSSEGSYLPNAHDVLKVRRILQHAVRDNPTAPAGLPTELVDMIIDTAEYWPSVVVRMPGKTVVDQDRDRELLRTGPLCYAVSGCLPTALLFDWDTDELITDASRLDLPSPPTIQKRAPMQQS